MKQTADSIVNRANNKIIVRNLWIADTFFSRLQGLLGTKTLLSGQGLLLRPCNGVHTFGMHYAIDILFLDRSYHVLRVVAALPPGRMAGFLSAAQALELPAGTSKLLDIQAGQQLAYLNRDY
ncbi:MAG TPA: DUF192 domain-containing protein [Negativicutes bacterium]|jgi:hypothetical protein